MCQPGCHTDLRSKVAVTVAIRQMTTGKGTELLLPVWKRKQAQKGCPRCPESHSSSSRGFEPLHTWPNPTSWSSLPQPSRGFCSVLFPSAHTRPHTVGLVTALTRRSPRQCRLAGLAGCLVEVRPISHPSALGIASSVILAQPSVPISSPGSQSEDCVLEQLGTPGDFRVTSSEMG